MTHNANMGYIPLQCSPTVNELINKSIMRQIQIATMENKMNLERTKRV